MSRYADILIDMHNGEGNTMNPDQIKITMYERVAYVTVNCIRCNEQRSFFARVVDDPSRHNGVSTTPYNPYDTECDNCGEQGYVVKTLDEVAT